MGKVGFFEMFRQDIFYGLKTLRRNPAFAVTAVLTLALSVSAGCKIDQ
jgi:hypothetical protein